MTPTPLEGSFSRTPSHLPVRLSIVAICLLITGLGWWTVQAKDAALAADLAARSNLARALAQHAHNTMQVADTALLAVRDRIDAEGPGTANAVRIIDGLRDRATALTPIEGVFVYDQSGKPIAGSAPGSPGGPDRDDFQYHRDHADLGTHVGRPIKSAATGDWVIPVTRRFDRPDGRFGGIVMAAIGIDGLERFYRSFELGRESVVSLDTAAGVAMVRSSGSGQWVGSDLSDLDVFRGVPPTAPAGDLRFVSPLDGVDRLVSYRHVDGYPLVVMVAHARREALAGWRRDARLHLGTAIGAALVLLIFGSRFRRRMERRETAERHHLLLADSVEEIVILKEGGRCAYVSPASHRILGYEPAELAGLGADDLIHPHDLPAALEAEGLLGPANPVVTHIHRNFRKDGSCVWVEAVHRRIDGVAGEPAVSLTIRDVSRHIALERTAMHAARRAALALEATSDFVVGVDRNWRVSYVNGRARAIWNDLGWDDLRRDDFGASGGRLLWDAAPALAGTAIEDCCRRAMADRVTQETTARFADGRWFTAHVAPLADDDRGLFVFLRDVTDGKRIEASLIEAQAAAGTIAGQLVAKRDQDDVTDIRANGEYLLALINDILDHSKSEAGRLPLRPPEAAPGAGRSAESVGEAVPAVKAAA